MKSSVKNSKKLDAEKQMEHTRSFEFNFDLHLEKITDCNYFSPYHFHNCIEIIYVLDGYIDFKIQNTMHNLKSEDCLIVNPGLIHSFKLDGNASYYIIQIPLSVFDTIEQTDILLIEKPAKRESLVLRERLSKMLKYYQSPSAGDQTMFVSKLYELVSLLITDYQDKTKEKADPDVLNSQKKILKALSYIEKHFKNDVSVSDVASHISISTESLNKQFKKMTGLTLPDYIMSLKIASFYDQFIHTNKTITVLMQKNGITNYNSFLREFKKIYGSTPDQLRSELPTGRKMQMELV